MRAQGMYNTNPSYHVLETNPILTYSSNVQESKVPGTVDMSVTGINTWLGISYRV